MKPHNETPEWEMAICTRIVGDEAPYTVEVSGVMPFGSLKLMDIGPMNSREDAESMVEFLKKDAKEGQNNG